jgi:hypothetical protein
MAHAAAGMAQTKSQIEAAKSSAVSHCCGRQSIVLAAAAFVSCGLRDMLSCSEVRRAVPHHHRGRISFGLGQSNEFPGFWFLCAAGMLEANRRKKAPAA